MKTVKRNFEFDEETYKALNEEASDNARTFPAHVMFILRQHSKQYMKRKQK